jgi:beta-phosphoglucomutase-like phosphatase (HAD superfamily)
MKVEAFLFDFDGTLVDTEEVWCRAIVDFLSSFGISSSIAEIMPNVVGRNWLDIDRRLHELYPVLGETTPEEDAGALRKFYDAYAADMDSMIIKSSIEFFIKASSIAPCAIVSGSLHSYLEEAADFCGIKEKTALILGAGEYESGKPSPSGYLKAAEILGVNPANCVVIEDSTVGVKSGIAAGMKVIAIKRSCAVEHDFTGASLIVSDLSEINVSEVFS